MIDANPENVDCPCPADGLGGGLHAISVRAGECRLYVGDGTFRHIGEQPAKAALCRKGPQPSRPIGKAGSTLSNLILKHGLEGIMSGKAEPPCQSHDTVRPRAGRARQSTRRGDTDLIRVVEDIACHLAQFRRKTEQVLGKPVENQL